MIISLESNNFSQIKMIFILHSYTQPTILHNCSYLINNTLKQILKHIKKLLSTFILTTLKHNNYKIKNVLYKQKHILKCIIFVEF